MGTRAANRFDYDDEDKPSGPVTSFQNHAAEGDMLAKQGDYEKAIDAYSRALAMRQADKHCLVARSKCYLHIGDSDAALRDAEESLGEDKEFFKGIFQKAEALYAKGDFEMALVFYHRGHKLRPELDEFRLGIQKASEAINNSIGNPKDYKMRPPATWDTSKTVKKTDVLKGTVTKPGIQQATGKVAKGDNAKVLKHLLGEMFADKEYLQILLNDRNFIPDTDDELYSMVNNGLKYLETRTDFWRQQKPMYTRKKEQKRIQARVQIAKSRQDALRQRGREEAERRKREHEEEEKQKRKERAANINKSKTKKLVHKQEERSEATATSAEAENAVYLLECLQNLQDEMRDALARSDKAAYSHALGNCGRVYAKLKDYSKAMACWQEKLPLSESNVESAWLHHDIGRCQLALGIIDEAIHSGEQSLKFAELAQEKKWMLNATILLGQSHLRIHHHEKAIEAYEKAHYITLELGDTNAANAIDKVRQELIERFGTHKPETQKLTSDTEVKHQEPKSETSAPAEKAESVTESTKELEKKPSFKESLAAAFGFKSSKGSMSTSQKELAKPAVSGDEDHDETVQHPAVEAPEQKAEQVPAKVEKQEEIPAKEQPVEKADEIPAKESSTEEKVATDVTPAEVVQPAAPEATVAVSEQPAAPAETPIPVSEPANVASEPVAKPEDKQTAEQVPQVQKTPSKASIKDTISAALGFKSSSQKSLIKPVEPEAAPTEPEEPKPVKEEEKPAEKQEEPIKKAQSKVSLGKQGTQASLRNSKAELHKTPSVKAEIQKQPSKKSLRESRQPSKTELIPKKSESKTSVLKSEEKKPEVVPTEQKTSSKQDVHESANLLTKKSSKENVELINHPKQSLHDLLKHGSKTSLALVKQGSKASLAAGKHGSKSNLHETTSKHALANKSSSKVNIAPPASNVEDSLKNPDKITSQPAATEIISAKPESDEPKETKMVEKTASKKSLHDAPLTKTASKQSMKEPTLVKKTSKASIKSKTGSKSSVKHDKQVDEALAENPLAQPVVTKKSSQASIKEQLQKKSSHAIMHHEPQESHDHADATGEKELQSAINAVTPINPQVEPTTKTEDIVVVPSADLKNE